MSGQDAARYAHSLPGRAPEHWETLADHLRDVGERAAGFASAFGAAPLGRAAGLLHDIGKASAAYQRYIAGDGPSPDHSTAGAQEARRRYEDQWAGALLVAGAVAGHHSGLADGVDLTARMDKRGLPDHHGWERHAPGLPDALPPIAATDGYGHAFLGRMIFSCLVDADSLATEAFYAAHHGKPVARGGHAGLDALRALVDAKLEAVARDAVPSPVNALRAEVLAHVRARAALPPGLFTLTVPTGSGKTWASLAFALDHALRHDLRRVIYVIPYTSIIDQTAELFRGVLGDENVLEHHGNVDWDAAETDAEGRDGTEKLKRAAENWDAPVVVTTAVQFFESLHANRRTRCRKLHNIARSVVVLDEAQTLPVHLLRPCVAAIAELARLRRERGAVHGDAAGAARAGWVHAGPRHPRRARTGARPAPPVRRADAGGGGAARRDAGRRGGGALRRNAADAVHREQPRPRAGAVRADPRPGWRAASVHADVPVAPPAGAGGGARGLGGRAARAPGGDQPDRGGRGRGLPRSVARGGGAGFGGAGRRALQPGRPAGRAGPGGGVRRGTSAPRRAAPAGGRGGGCAAAARRRPAGAGGDARVFRDAVLAEG